MAAAKKPVKRKKRKERSLKTAPATHSARQNAASAHVKPRKRACTSSDQRLRLIAQVTGAVVGSKPLVQQARELAEQVRAAFGADICAIRLLEEEELVLLACAGVRTQDLDPRIPLKYGMAQLIVSRRQPLFIPDTNADPVTARIMHHPFCHCHFTSYAGAPLISKDRVIGILGIYAAKELRGFSDADLSCLQIFGNNIAAAIVNDRLYEEMRRQRDQLDSETAERKRAEEAVRKSEAKYRTLIETTDTGFVIVGSDGRVLDANAEYVRLTGHKTQQEIIGRKVTEWTAKHDRSRNARAVRECLVNGSVRNLEIEYVDGEGRLTPIEINGTVLQTAEGVRIVTLCRDITERKQVEQALRKSEERLTFALEVSQTGEWDLDLADHTAHHSLRHDRIFGYDTLLPHWTYEMFLEHVLPDDRELVARQVSHAINAQENYDCECRIVRCDKVVRWISVRGRVLRDPDGKPRHIAGVVQDITDRKQAEEERERISAQLREAQKLEAVGRFGRGVAHDFNNLMATVLGQASHMKSSRQAGHPDYASLTQIEDAAETAARLAHQLLAFAKGGKIRPRLLPFADVVKSALTLVPPMVPRNVVVDHHIASGLWRVECDQTQIQQVIVNLCRNALEAMPEGGRVGIRTENVALTSPLSDAQPPLGAGHYVCLTVDDTGCGMDAETMKLIFDPFFTTKEHGHGLGLAAAHGIMGAHGGAISVTSATKKGSTFRMWLPRAKSERKPPASRRH